MRHRLRDRGFSPLRVTVSFTASFLLHTAAVALVLEGGATWGSSAPQIVLVDLVRTVGAQTHAPPDAAHALPADDAPEVRPRPPAGDADERPPLAAADEAPPAATTAEHDARVAEDRTGTPEPVAHEAVPLTEDTSALLAERPGARERAGEPESRYREEIEALAAEVRAVTADNAALKAQVTERHDRVATLERALEAERRAKEAALAEQRSAHERLVAALRDEIEGKDIALREARQGLTLSIANRVLFPSGQAKLTPEGEQLVEKVAAALRGVGDRRILIEGHTDNVPIGPDLAWRFPSNWELSGARASEVVRHLTGRGIPGDRLLAAGRADTQPAASNATEAGRQQNRRIEIILLPAPPPGDETG
jgi:chemotaxis protein MotB